MCGWVLERTVDPQAIVGDVAVHVRRLACLEPTGQFMNTLAWVDAVTVHSTRSAP